MIAWLTARVGAKPVLYIVAALLLVGIVFLLGRCSMGDDNSEVVAQIEQNHRTTKAITDAAEDAIATIGDRTATENTIDQATEQAMTEIDHAQDVDAIRAVVIAGVCGQASHRNDPACRVQPSRP